MAHTSIEHRFELPKFIAPSNIEELKLLPLPTLCNTDLDWPLEVNEVAITEPENTVEVEFEFEGLGTYFRPTPHFHIDRLKPGETYDYELVMQAVAANRVNLTTFLTSTGTEFVALTLVIQEALLNEFEKRQCLTPGMRVEFLNTYFGADWIDVVIGEPEDMGTKMRKQHLEKLVEIKEYECVQLPDLHFAKGSLQKSLHRTAIRRADESNFRNFRRLYSMIAE